MVAAIRQDAPSVRAPVLLIEAAEKVPAPSPLFRSGNQRRRIDRFDLPREIKNLGPDFVHRRTRRMDIAMRPMPEARLVVENVVRQPAIRGRAPTADEML